MMRRMFAIVGLSIGVGCLASGPAGANDFYRQGMKKVAVEEWPAALDLLEKAASTSSGPTERLLSTHPAISS